jgi:hypothetical protein
MPIVRQCRLDDERMALLRQDLPDRFRLPLPPLSPTAMAPMNFAPLVDALQDFRTDYMDHLDAAEARAEAQRAQSKTTTPVACWAENLRRLTRLCNGPDPVGSEPVDLPPMWMAMADQGHRQDCLTIESHLNQVELYSGAGGLTGDLINVPAQLATDLGQLRFIRESPDVIGVGLSIFLVSYPTVGLVTCLRSSVEQYNQQMRCSQPLTLTEANQIRDRQKFELPTNYQGVKQVCLVYHCLLVVALGEEHPVAKHFGLFVLEFVDLLDLLSHYLDGSVARCTGVLRHIQVVMYHCLRDALRGRQASLPDFTGMLTDIKLHRWIPLTIPNVTNTSLPGAQGRNRAFPGGAAPGAVAISVVVYAPPLDLDRVLVPEIPNFDPAAFIKSRGKPPLNDKGIPMCLRYHVKGKCETGCIRARDHHKHTQVNSTRLAAYLAQPKP